MYLLRAVEAAINYSKVKVGQPKGTEYNKKKIMKVESAGASVPHPTYLF